jgi:hypothetical protein
VGAALGGQPWVLPLIGDFSPPRVCLTELVDTDGAHGVDTPFLTVVNTAEAVYNNPSSTRAQLLAQQKILERVNLGDE